MSPRWNHHTPTAFSVPCRHADCIVTEKEAVEQGGHVGKKLEGNCWDSGPPILGPRHPLLGFSVRQHTETEGHLLISITPRINFQEALRKHLVISVVSTARLSKCLLCARHFPVCWDEKVSTTKAIGIVKFTF